jgi:hypothetical protein
MCLPAPQRSRPSAFAGGIGSLPISFKPKARSRHGTFTVRQATSTLRQFAGSLGCWVSALQLPHAQQPVAALAGWVCCAARARRLLGSVVCKFGFRRLRVSRTVGRCQQERLCSLTLRSSGAPTACRQAWAMGARTFSMAQACRHAVGAPLSSNVRQHVQASWCASISIQIQRVAAIGSIQSVASCLWYLQRSWLCQTLVLRRS